jgi:uncharacterized radical SAM superfamily Fe-S cluster-containing enzyme
VTTAETTAGTGTKVDRDEVFLEYTKSICPVCKVVIDAQVNIRDKVFLRERCPTHGPFGALLYSDAQMYMDSLRFNKPAIPLETQTEVVDGCPLDCGSLGWHRCPLDSGIRASNPTPAVRPTAETTTHPDSGRQKPSSGGS